MSDLQDYMWTFEDGFFLGIGIIILIIFLIIVAFAIGMYVFQGIALMELAKKNNIPNAWLAWLPVGNMYLLGKLGFETYAPVEKKNQTFTWILFGCSAGTTLLSDTGLFFLASVATTVFATWAYFYIFNKINSKNCVVFTVLTAIFAIGGLLLFFNRKNFTNENVVNISNEELKNTSNEENNETEEKAKFCIYCGNKLNKTSKFCSKCGSKI